MTVPTNNITFSSLQTEFSGSNPISLSEYYRGGTYVPPGTTSSYGTIPTSGQISLGVFRGTVAGPADIITITDNSPFDSGFKVNTARWTLNNTGTVTYTQWNSDASYSWINNTANVNKYEILATITTPASGANVTGTFDTWLDCATTRQWSISAAFSDELVMNVSIRDKVSLTVMDTAIIDFTIIYTG